MPRTYKHLFFDLDHTLWDFEGNSESTLERLYKEFDLATIGVPSLPDMIRSFNVHNDKLWVRYRNGFIKREELRWKRMWLMLLDFKIADTTLSHELSTAFLEILPTQTRLIPHAKEILEHCKDRYELHLITNGFETTQRLKLHYSGIARYFSQLITSEKSNSMKPYKDIFDYALNVTGAKVEDSIMIGDAVDIDILGAINAGWDSVYFNPAGISHKHKPTYEVTHLKELEGIF